METTFSAFAMAKLHLAQIAYLSQQLINQVTNVNNLIVRGKLELSLVQETLNTLLTVCGEWIADGERDYEQR